MHVSQTFYYTFPEANCGTAVKRTTLERSEKIETDSF